MNTVLIIRNKFWSLEINIVEVLTSGLVIPMCFEFSLVFHAQLVVAQSRPLQFTKSSARAHWQGALSLPTVYGPRIIGLSVYSNHELWADSYFEDQQE